MTLTSPPYVLQGSSHGAQLFRQAPSSLLNPAGGIVQASDFALTQNGSPNMSVNVGAGRIWIPGTSLSTVNPGGGAYYPQGAYYAENDAAVNLAISASDPSNPRIDTVIVQVQDAAYVGATNSVAPAVITGTPTSGATLVNLNGKGSVPVSSMVIGYVLVPANATTVVTADLATTVTQVLPSLGGVFLSGLDASKPTAANNRGAQYLATDSNALYYSDGTTWRTIYGARGATNIAASEARTNAAYGLLTTPDQVQNVVLPTNGLIEVGYHATWQESVTGAAQAAIFLGANQLQIANAAAAPGVQSANINGSIANRNVNLFTTGGGLLSAYRPTNAYTGDVTTGQIMGYEVGATASVFDAGASGTLTPIPSGSCLIFAAAGTYTVSVQFLATSGTVTASNRKLWVRALPFG